MTRPQRWKPLRLAAVTLVTGALALAGCSQPASQPSSPAASGGGDGKDYSNTLLTLPREDMGTFTRNFNPFSPNAAPMTQQAIYEPLLIFSATTAFAVGSRSFGSQPSGARSAQMSLNESAPGMAFLAMVSRGPAATMLLRMPSGPR